MLPMPTSTNTFAPELTRVLSTEELDFFTRNGFIHIKHFVDRATVQTFLREIQRVEANWLAEDVDKLTSSPA